MNRRRRTTVSLILVGIFCRAGGHFCSVPSSAAKEEAEPPKNVAPTAFRAGTLDLGRLFVEDIKFKRLSERLKADIAESEAGVQRRKDKLDNRKAEAKKLPNDSQEYKRLSAELEIDDALFQTDLGKLKAKFIDREAKNYWSVLQEISLEVRRHCKTHDVHLVIRVSKAVVNPDDHQSILNAINQSVLYDDGIDITDDILAALNMRPDRRGN